MLTGKKTGGAVAAGFVFKPENRHSTPLRRSCPGVTGLGLNCNISLYANSATREFLDYQMSTR